jgi:hypothetical protein
VALGELAIAAGVLGHSVTVACDLPANVLCQIWRHHAQSLGSDSVIHARTKKDIKLLLEGHVAGIRAVFVYFEQLTKLGLVTARREHANGPIRYEIPEELTNVESPFSTLPTIRSSTRN